jgi:lipoprotein-releasing system permease protein
LSFEFFISKRIRFSKAQDIKVSKPILRIAAISIALSIVVNLVTLAIVTGFQNEIRQKVTGYSAPIILTKAGFSSIIECEPIQKSERITTYLNGISGIINTNAVAYKPGLIQSSNYTDTIRLNSGKDSILQKQEVLGILMKGVESKYNWDFISKNLISGRIPMLFGDTPTDEIILSRKICKTLNLTLNQSVSFFFVKEKPIMRKFKIVGIFDTGFEDYDKKMIFCDIRHIQKLNDYGISTTISIDDTLIQNRIIIRADVAGKTDNLSFDWGQGADKYQGKAILTNFIDTTLRVIVYQYDGPSATLLPVDTSIITLHKTNLNSPILLNEEKELTKIASNESGSNYAILLENGELQISVKEGKGTWHKYIAGYEVQLNDWNDHDKLKSELAKHLEMKPTENGDLITVKSIIEQEQDLFNWLSFLDINVAIILSLMIIIGIINMGSALLVMIVVRTNFIGILKSMGATDWSIRKIFIFQAGRLILKGMIYGNLFGLLLYYLQASFGIIKLDPTVYYLSQVPMQLSVIQWLLLNVVSFTVCISALLIPSIVISRISPIKSIKFN